MLAHLGVLLAGPVRAIGCIVFVPLLARGLPLRGRARAGLLMRCAGRSRLSRSTRRPHASTRGELDRSSLSVVSAILMRRSWALFDGGRQQHATAMAHPCESSLCHQR